MIIVFEGSWKTTLMFHSSSCVSFSELVHLIFYYSETLHSMYKKLVKTNRRDECMIYAIWKITSIPHIIKACALFSCKNTELVLTSVNSETKLKIRKITYVFHSSTSNFIQASRVFHMYPCI